MSYIIQLCKLANPLFRNAVELIVSIIALAKGDVLIVKTSLIGSILSNLLLVTGMCFFLGGLGRQEQFFNETAAGTAASLLAAAISWFIIPTAFDLSVSTNKSSIAPISRGTAIILLFVYCCYLLFQLKTHAEMYNQEIKKVPRKSLSSIFKNSKEERRPPTPPDIERLPNIDNDSHRDNDSHEPQLHIWVAISTLVLSTAVVGLCSEFMVDSIEALTATTNISANFIGLILLPIVGNAVEHITAVKVACKDKMDLAINVAVGSSMQIALLVIPFITVLGWAMGNNEMTLSFDVFQIAILFVSVWVVNYLISDAKSHWLEGILLMCLYGIIALTSW
jgi:Ca2+:H+ antiporter